MTLTPLPWRATQDEYEQQAGRLFAAWQAGDENAVRIFRNRHPRFLDDKIPWLEKNLSDKEIRGAALDRSDAKLVLARWYDFDNWIRLEEHAYAASREGSLESRFEPAVEAVIDGDVRTLTSMLRTHPELAHDRSTRVTHFDPQQHGAMLLHYVAANGVEGYRQRTPANAVDVARLLLEAGAEADALAGFYGGQHTTMSMLVSSSHPVKAGVQVPLVDLLVDFGASVEGKGWGHWTSPLVTALVFGCRDAAEALVRRGARIETVAAAAGLGRLDRARDLLPEASAEDRHRALALAAQLGQVEIVRLLLDAGEDANRYNPAGTHSHATPLHQAINAGHLDVVQLLVDRGVRLDIKDTIYHGTPLGWAVYCDKPEIAEYLKRAGAV